MLALAFLALLAAAFASTATESAAHHGLLTLTIAEIRHLITMMIIKLLRDTAYLLWWSARDEPTKLAPATSTTNDQPEPDRSRSVGGEQLSRPVDQDLLGCGVDGLTVGSFDEFAGLEAGSGADEGDEVGCVHGAPAVLGGLDELECHREPGGARTRALGDLRAMPDCGEGRFDRVRGAQVNPMLGGDRIGRAARWFP